MASYAFFDIDWTLYGGYTVSEFYLFLARRRLISNPLYVFETDRKISELYEAGAIDYAEATRRVLQLTADILKGAKTTLVERWAKQFIHEENKVFPWVPAIMALLKKGGFAICFISAAAQPHVQAISSVVKADVVFSSKLGIENETYTGSVDHVLNYEEKGKIIRGMADIFSLGFGDSLGDVDMLSSCTHAFIYNPVSEKLKQTAKEKNWHIVNEASILNEVSRTINSGFK